MFTRLTLKKLNGKTERETNMDNLTAIKKSDLISDCIAAEDSISKLHIDVRKNVFLFSRKGIKCGNIFRY